MVSCCIDTCTACINKNWCLWSYEPAVEKSKDWMKSSCTGWVCGRIEGMELVQALFSGRDQWNQRIGHHSEGCSIPWQERMCSRYILQHIVKSRGKASCCSFLPWRWGAVIVKLTRSSCTVYRARACWLDFWCRPGSWWPICDIALSGVWASGDKWHYAPLAKSLSSSGVITCVMTHSLFPNARVEEMTEEVTHALDWVLHNIESHGGSPDKVWSVRLQFRICFLRW